METIQETQKFTFGFSGWRYPVDVQTAHLFRCPVCITHFRPPNVQCITCPNCGEGGNLHAFSGVEKAA